jgi:glycosyltransferase involved in cell wall biosynthesis
MPFYVVKPDSFEVHSAYERSSRACLLTDAQSEDEIPREIRSAVDTIQREEVVSWHPAYIPPQSDAVLFWFAGDRLLQGSSAGIRHDLLLPGRRSFVAVHYPCLSDMDLIGIQPRSWTRGTGEDYINRSYRIAASSRPSSALVRFLQASPEPWARLCNLLQIAQEVPDKALAGLAEMWSESRLHPILATLVLRNLIVLLIRLGNISSAEQLLESGMKAFPKYAELPFLAMWLRARQGKPQGVVGCLKRAVEQSDPSFIGSGGENSYRAHWLLGAVAESAGNQAVAYRYFFSGLLANPAFEPSIVGILRQRFPFRVAQELQISLCAMVRRDPRYFEPVFYFLLLHRQIEAARRMLELVRPPEPRPGMWHEQLESVAAAYRPALQPDSAKPGVMLIGNYFSNASFARINREIGAALMSDSKLDVSLEPHDFALAPARVFNHHEALSQGLMRRVAHLDLTIRHHWPPDFSRPSCGKLLSIVPWEFGAVPRRWVKEIEENVDELCVCSHFVRDVFVRCGVDPSRISVVPYGVDRTVFTPEGIASRPAGSRGFVFLFVGGAIARKGIDLLLKAYQQAFTAADDVTLIIKELGSKTFYRGLSLTREIRRAMRRSGMPHMILISDEMADSELAALYRGCDAFILPYRGEGFGMPLAEALACGKPVITTGSGPAKEFCPSEASCFISAQEVEVPQPHPPLGEMAGPFTWFEPDLEELTATMRYVYEHREEAKHRGTSAVEAVHRAFDWSRVTALYLERIRRLCLP